MDLINDRSEAKLQVECELGKIKQSITKSKIKTKYGIDGYGYVNYENARNHYPFFIPLENGLLNGKYTIPEKKNFFIDIARER